MHFLLAKLLMFFFSGPDNHASANWFHQQYFSAFNPRYPRTGISLQTQIIRRGFLKPTEYTIVYNSKFMTIQFARNIRQKEVLPVDNPTQGHPVVYACRLING